MQVSSLKGAPEVLWRGSDEGFWRAFNLNSEFEESSSSSRIPIVSQSD